MNHFLTHNRVLDLRSSWFDGQALGAPPYAYISTFDLAETTVEENTIPAVQICFSGFQCLATNPWQIEAFVGKVPDSRWATVGFGVVMFHEDMVNKLQPDLTEEDRKWVVKFIAETGIKLWVLEDISFIIMMGPLEAPGIVSFTVTKPIPQEEWHRLYAAKSLELTAAHEYFKSLGGEMKAEPVVPDDLKHDRNIH